MVNRMLALAGAEVVERDFITIQKLSKPTSLQGKPLQVDLIIVSLFEYSEAFAKYNVSRAGDRISPFSNRKDFKSSKQDTNHKPSDSTVSPSLSEEEIKMLQVVEANSESSSGNGTPRVVSADWFFSCLQAGSILNIHDLDIFTMPSEPIAHPFAYKSKRSGERYTKYDTVYYSHENSSVDPSSSKSIINVTPKPLSMTPSRRGNGHPSQSPNSNGGEEKIGMIMNFTATGGSSVQIRVRPLVSCIDGALLSPSELRERLGRTTCDGNNLDLRKELMLGPEDSEITIDESCLRDKAVILDVEMFCSVKYSTRKSNEAEEGAGRTEFYFADASLENWREMDDRETEGNISRMSQDY